MLKELPLVSLFGTFIKESLNGKRRMPDGKRLKPQSVENYKYVLKYVMDYELFSGKNLTIKINLPRNERIILKEKKYWKEFYRKFSDFLFLEKNCFDNYVGCVFKTLKCFFRYLKNEKYMVFPDFYENFYVPKEEIRIISLLPERFYFLISNKEFENNLNYKLRRWKDVFVFGCTTALRFSDLMNLRVRDIECIGQDHFLYYRSMKTDTPVNMKLPPFAVNIFLKYSISKRATDKLFPSISLLNFNKHIRSIAKQAKWVEVVGKFRSRNGKPIEIANGQHKLYKFCDLITSHVMRRTGITNLLMMGMPEYMVRKISGHSAQSESFFRYVNFAQSYITEEIDKVFEKLQKLYGSINC
ncbi:MAG: tyrosine-type recombinase/integrase [Bacteroidota bacterium]